ncbi:Aste57867_19384 [Aphanomyces stellatus]|uniref:Aste57867_19384 protein n=1 Tax=Aphanomyces stellatus TaxID=120398 RepID=A0A485LD78_9STRA|nr:hypothetical protein As57867_019320 [Aphanomyces stellatus]VFT96098.1 Aste57867_19384 [Aphanomyces stellatus]
MMLRTMWGRGVRHISWMPTLTLPSTRRTQKGLFGLDGLVQPEDFGRLSADAIAEIGRLKKQIVARPPGLSTIQDLDAISNAVCIVIDAAELCRNVHPDERFRKAATRSFAQLSTLIQELNTDTDMYLRLRDVTDNAVLMAGFTEEQRRVAVLLRNEFERDGIHLNSAGRDHVMELQNRITDLSTQFQHNITTIRDCIEVPRKSLRMFPANYLAHCASSSSSSDVVSVPTDTHVMSAVLKWIPDPTVRRQMYTAGNTCASANLHVLDELIHARHELATTLGFDTYAHLATSDKMVQTPDRVDAFLKSIADNLMTKATAERELLLAAKQQYEGSFFGQTTLESWDIPYYMGLLKARHHQLDSRVISAYFPVERCVEGLQLLCAELFGVTLTESAMVPHETWHPDVRKLDLTCPAGAHLGVLYLDLYPRAYKYNHFAHFTIRCGKRLEHGAYQTPVAALVCNFQQPTPSTPPLLTHGEVETLFHEFGHALHSVLSQTEFQHVSGTRGQLDFVETPSHLFEYFAWDPRVVETFARHYDTNAPIPRAMLDNLRQSKHMFSAMDAQTQCLYSLLDLTLFGTQPLPFAPPTTTQALATLQSQNTLVPYAAGTFWHTRFGHLVNYGAGYYSYLYARVFAADIWEECFAADPWNPKAGAAVYEGMLRHGGAKEPMAMLRDILGREPSSRSFLKELGVDHNKQV